MVKELSQGRARLGASGLLAVDGVEGAVDPGAGGSKVEAPGGELPMQGVVIKEHNDVGQQDHDPPHKGEEVGGDPHGHHSDSPLPVVVEDVVQDSVLAWFVLVVV